MLIKSDPNADPKPPNNNHNYLFLLQCAIYDLQGRQVERRDRFRDWKGLREKREGRREREKKWEREREKKGIKYFIIGLQFDE